MNKHTDILDNLAKQSPQGFAWARDVIEAQKQAKGAFELGDFLKSQGVPYADYIREVSKGVSKSGTPGDVLEAFRNAPDHAAKYKSQFSNLGVAHTPANLPIAKGQNQKALAEMVQKNPEVFTVLKEYIGNESKGLEKFLESAGLNAKEALKQIKATTGMDSGAVLEAMRKESSFVSDASRYLKVAAKVPVLGKAATAVSLVVSGIGVANASTPEESKTAKAALRDEVIDLIDPTMGIVSKGVPAALKDLEENGDRRKAESKVNPHNLRIQRAQEFILSDQHPGQLGALKLKDSAGKDVNVVETLRNPATRQTVMSEIDTRLSNATSPEMKDQFQGMKQAAVEFSSLQDRIKAPAVAAPAAQPQQMAAKTPVKEMELSLQ